MTGPCQWVAIAEAAAHLATTERHMRRLVHEKKVPFHKLGGKVRFDLAELDQWMSEQ